MNINKAKNYLINKINIFSNIKIKTDNNEYLFERNSAVLAEIIYVCMINNRVIEFSIYGDIGVILLKKGKSNKFFYKTSLIIQNKEYLVFKDILEKVLPNIESYLYLNDEEIDLTVSLIDSVFESIQTDVKYIRLLKDNDDNFYLNAKTMLNKRLNFRYRKIDNEVYYDRFESYWFGIPSVREPMDLNSYMNEALKPQQFENLFAGFAFILSFRNVYRNANVYQITFYNHDNYNFYYVIDDDNKKEFFMLLKNNQCKTLDMKNNDGIIYAEELVYSDARSKMGQNNFFMNNKITKLMLEIAYKHLLNKKFYDAFGLQYGEELSDDYIEMVKLMVY